MTSLYVNHEDIRQFVARLAKVRPADKSIFSCLEHVAYCFGLSHPEFSHRLRVDGPVVECGLPLDREAVHKLAKTLMEHDITGLKNTKRLDLVAAAFGWKADAFMHHLKSTTASLGCNPSMADTFSALPEPTLEALNGGPNLAKWKSSIGLMSQGLYIVAGPTGCGKSTTLQRSALHLAKTFDDRIVEGKVPEEGTDESFSQFFNAYVRGWSGLPAVVYMEDIQSDREARFALRLAESTVVLATIHAGSPLQAVSALGFRAGGASLNSLKGVLTQSLVRSAQWNTKRGGRIIIADYTSFEWGDAQKALAEPLPKTHCDGLFVDAVSRIEKGDTTYEFVSEVFGEAFNEYLARTPAS